MGCQVPTVILLTGKGAETRQKRGIEYIDCPSDVDYAKEYLHEYDVQHGMDGIEQGPGPAGMCIPLFAPVMRGAPL